ncbi:MAG: hypothetical protein LWY06_02765 [Firmicutes bacterium]|nr:hypothetical protein [Bacillota bacterium]
MIEAVSQKKEKNWLDTLALLISGVLSPYLIMPVFVVIVCLTYSKTITEFITYFLLCFSASTIIPFVYILICVKRNNITDLHVAELGQRKKPFIVTLVGVALIIGILTMIHAPKEIIILGYVMLLNGFIFFIISLFWKISMHSSILAGVVTSLMVLVNSTYGYGFLLIPILIWARMRRQRHSLYQGITATILASLGTFLLFKAFGYQLIKTALAYILHCA